jgi:hypothetical protein
VEKKENQQRRIMPILFPVILVIAGILYYVFNPSTENWFFKCPFHLFTGLQCPGCGLQRALHCLLHGDVMGALSFNAYIIVILPVLLMMVLGEWYNYHHWFDWANRLLNNRTAMIIIIVLTFVWWVVRNIVGI